MLGGQAMEEAGVRARPMSTRAESQKERSLLGPSGPDPWRFGHQVKSFLDPPRRQCPPAAQGSGPSTPPGRQFRLLLQLSSDSGPGPPSHTPFLPARPGPPTALPGGGCRSPSAIFSTRRRGCSRFPLPVHPHLSPASPGFQQGNERRLARTGSRELQSLA